ncbi:MAG TPA: archaemetzincin [Pyrinomonadaceae bacterium]|nr:archaemetzincin [Pyrinomonadaceae bacterium]
MNRAFLLLFLLISSCSYQPARPVSNANTQETGQLVAPDDLTKAMEAVKPFFEPMRAPGPTDWLATFHEPGQTFAEYLNSNPTVPTSERHTIYVLPLGMFSAEQSKAIAMTDGYLEAFYGLTVKQLPQQPIKRPARAVDSRTNEVSHKTQIRTGYIMDDILRPMLPKDAAALIAFTNEDLYPDSTMNYVFGQASMENRVGVWSLYRLDDNAAFHTFLLRTIKIAAHETGHMFSMHHCTKYNCVMSGSNHLAETDYHPIDACPECMAKICWFSHVLPSDRYRKLADFCRANGLQKEAEDFEKKYEAVNGKSK